MAAGASEQSPIMETKTAGPGAFAGFDLSRVPSPCFVVDEQALRQNLAKLAQIRQASGAHIYLALKAFSMFSVADIVMEYLDGTSASGLYEARLGKRHFGGGIATFAPAFKADEIDEICQLSDHILFNSLTQIEKFGAIATRHDCEIGLRINPEYRTGEIEKYDPCALGSRLGTPVSALTDGLPEEVVGLHMHSLCEQGFDALQHTLSHLMPFLEKNASQLKWINLGGGHMLSARDYDADGLINLIKDIRQRLNVEVYLEPGMAIAFDAGILVGEVLDVMENDGPVAILDISATCHMPDVLEAPYRPGLMQEVADGVEVRFGGPSCLAGDVIGNYRLAALPQAGDRLAFLDQAHYSMVKTNSFNGVPLPAIALWNSQTDILRLIRQFSYDDFEMRLS